MSEEELCERICQLEKELKEEKEKNQKILSDNIETFQKLFAEEISKIYISKDKIREKIKILEMEIRYDFIDNTKAIKVLNDLLEE